MSKRETFSIIYYKLAVLTLIVVEVQASNGAPILSQGPCQPHWSNLSRVNCATLTTGYEMNGRGMVIVTSTYVLDECVESLNRLEHIVEGQL